jgi:hypothetical protein
VSVAADRKSWETVAEFHIKNPLWSSYPVWVPDPLPTTRLAGDLSVTLTEFRTGLSIEDPAKAARTNETIVTRASLQATQGDKASPNWQAKMVEISDASGNRWAPFLQPESLTPAGSQYDLSWVGGLWPGEPAWRLRFEFSRTAGFAPEELWTVRGLRVPQPTEILTLDNSTTNQAATLSLVAFTGADADQPGDLKWLMEKGEPRLSIRAAPVLEGWRLSLVSIVDDHRRPVDTHPSADWGWTKGQLVFGLKLQPGAASVDCTFALHQSRFVEFLARPEFPNQSDLRP